MWPYGTYQPARCGVRQTVAYSCARCRWNADEEYSGRIAEVLHENNEVVVDYDDGDSGPVRLTGCPQGLIVFRE